jgi:hypothetical protein
MQWNSFAQGITGFQIAAAVQSEFPPRSLVLILPTRNSLIDFSLSASTITQQTAAALRVKGFSVRTLAERDVEGEVLQRIGRSGVVDAASVSRLGTALGIRNVITLALTQGGQQNDLGVTASVYARTGASYEEVWKSKIGWREPTPIPRQIETASSQPLGSCTSNLVLNGDFSRDWPNGWSRSSGGEGGNVTEVTNGSNGRALHIRHTGNTDIALSQIVALPPGRITFQFEGRFHTWEGPIAGFSGMGHAGINLALLDARRNTLGVVWAGNYVHNIFEGTGLAGVPEGPRNTPTAAFLEAPGDKNVREQLDVTRFVQDHLVRVNPRNISFVGISIAAGATHPSAGAELWVGDISLTVCPN